MKIEKFVVGELQANCYLVSGDTSDECFIIDPGDEANLISENILRRNLKPKAIIATHAHFDHILAANELQMAFDIPFYIHPDDEKIVNYMTDSAQHWLKREIIEQPPSEIKYIKEGEKIEVGSWKLEVFHTPGHSPGGICIVGNPPKASPPSKMASHLGGQEIIFTGDTVFKNGIGRTDFSYGSPDKMKQSLQKIRNNFKGYTAYPGHGESFIL